MVNYVPQKPQPRLVSAGFLRPFSGLPPSKRKGDDSIMREKINNLTQSDKTYFKTLNIIFGGIMHEYRYKYRDLWIYPRPSA